MKIQLFSVMFYIPNINSENPNLKAVITIEILVLTVLSLLYHVM